MTQEEQRGFTLPVAMFALWVVGLIMTGGVFMRQEGRMRARRGASAWRASRPVWHSIWPSRA